MAKQGFEGLTVLITGASSGIGAAFAHKLAARRANLILTARSAGALEQLAQTLRQQYSITVKIILADLAEPGSARVLFDTVSAGGTHVDLLINNAGFGKVAHFLAEDLSTYQHMLSLNISAVVDLTYLFIRDMRTRGNGGVINIASTAAFQPVSYMAVYAASKSFVLSFTEALAGEYQKHGVHCLALCPGSTATNFMAVANAITTGMSFARPEDVAEAGLNAYLKKRNSYVPGTLNYLLSLLPRLLPRDLAITIAAKVFEKRVVAWNV